MSLTLTSLNSTAKNKFFWNDSMPVSAGIVWTYFKADEQLSCSEPYSGSETMPVTIVNPPEVLYESIKAWGKDLASRPRKCSNCRTGGNENIFGSDIYIICLCLTRWRRHSVFQIGTRPDFSCHDDTVSRKEIRIPRQESPRMPGLFRKSTGNP